MFNSKPKEDTKPEVNKETKVKKDSWLATYGDYLLNRITKGNLEEQTSNFQISFNKILSERFAKQTIHIMRFPTLVPIGHLDKIRADVMNTLPANDIPNVEIQFNIQYQRRFISLSDKKLSKLYSKANMAVAHQRAIVDELQDYLSQTKVNLSRNPRDRNFVPVNTGRITIQDLNLAIENFKLKERKLFSFEEVIQHKREGGEYATAVVFIEVAAKDRDLLEKVMENITGALQRGYNKEPYEFAVLTAMEDYLKEHGIASLQQKGKKGLRLSTMDLPTSLLGIDEEFKSGIIRSTNPRVCLGNGVENNSPIHVDFTETNDSYNMMVLADSGAGKTVMLMHLCLELMLDPRSNLIIDDLKGLEWTPFAKLFDSHTIVSFNLANPTFVNTLKIPDWRKFRFPNPRSAYLLAFNSTLRMLGSLFIVPKELEMTLNTLLSDLISYVYLSSGVDVEEPQKYSLSHSMKFAETIHTKWDSFAKLKSFEDKYDPRLVDLVNDTIYEYFSPRGAKKLLFSKEVNVEEIVGSKVIVFDHGKDLGGSSGKTPQEIICGMVQKNYISNLYTSMNAYRGEYTYEIIEEVVRQLHNPYTTAYLRDELVGKRSLNKRNILIFNSLDILLNPTENKDDISSIREQIGIYMVGRNKPKVVEQLVQHIGQPEIKETLMKVAKQSHMTPKYDKSFAYVNYHTGSVRGVHAYKSVIPKSILDFMKQQV